MGGQDKNRKLIRKIITRLAGIYVWAVLNLKIRDVSSGFRCFKREVLEKIGTEKISALGPSVVLEILYKTSLNGFRIKEIPIVFTDRKYGKTKLKYASLLEALFTVAKLRKVTRC